MTFGMTKFLMKMEGPKMFCQRFANLPKLHDHRSTSYKEEWNVWFYSAFSLRRRQHSRRSVEKWYTFLRVKWLKDVNCHSSPNLKTKIEVPPVVPSVWPFVYLITFCILGCFLKSLCLTFNHTNFCIPLCTKPLNRF